MLVSTKSVKTQPSFRYSKKLLLGMPERGTWGSTAPVAFDRRGKGGKGGQSALFIEVPSTPAFLEINEIHMKS